MIVFKKANDKNADKFLYYIMSVRDDKALVALSEKESSKSDKSRDDRNELYMTYQKRCVFWGYIMMLIVFFVAMTAMAGSAWSPMQRFSQSDSFYFANQVAYEWTQGFVQNILVTSDSSCPDGYEHAVQFKWAGTGFGCHCSTSENISFVLEGYCSPALIQSNCVNMPSQRAIISSRWRNSSTICMRRSNLSFATESKFDNSGDYKLCGSSRSLVIVPTANACPLVNISFSIFPLENNTKTISDSNSLLPPIFASFNSTSPFSFYSYPVSKLAVSEQEFCLIDDDTGLTPGHKDFILLNTLRGCLEEGYYTTLDTMTEIDFYSNNPALNVLQNISGFPKASNWKYRFGFANLPGWTYECRHNYDNKFSITTARAQFNFQYFESYRVAMILLICVLTGVGIEAFILVLRRCFNTSVYPTGYKQIHLPMEFGWALSRYVIDVLLKLTTIGLCLYITWTAYVEWNWFKAVANFNCYDSNSAVEEMVVLPYIELYLKTLQLSLAMSVVVVLMVVIDVVHFRFIYTRELQYYLVWTGKAIVKQSDEDDLKWMNERSNMGMIPDIQPENHDHDGFRVTMSNNQLYFEEEEEPQRPDKPKKKMKKKRLSPMKRMLETGAEEDKQEDSNQQLPTFNPYELDDPGMFINVIANSTTKEEAPRRMRRN